MKNNKGIGILIAYCFAIGIGIFGVVYGYLRFAYCDCGLLDIFLFNPALIAFGLLALAYAVDYYPVVWADLHPEEFDRQRLDAMYEEQHVRDYCRGKYHV